MLVNNYYTAQKYLAVRKWNTPYRTSCSNLIDKCGGLMSPNGSKITNIYDDIGISNDSTGYYGFLGGYSKGKLLTKVNDYYDLANNSSNGYSHYGGVYIVFGQGDTAPTINDYTLENSYTYNIDYVGLSESSITHSFDDLNNCVIYTININFQAKKDLTIKEIGLTQRYIPDNSTSPRQKPFLLSREVLETPVKITANQTFTISETLYQYV